MTLPPDKAWWPRKTVGCGWAWPRRWQGVVVTVGYIATLVAAGVMASISAHLGWFFVYAFVATAALIALCFWKGEDPG